ncbi:MAG: hypothetical protein F2881_10545 [Actinobacteria bacterium]|uniref:Unannotated protein n=1 Tax=freshwater metagenome TaxID=449393 RepID=A0A6J7RDG1_9ZZZZ|nr:hypothetical protein [Actinomycetota bacterium]
MSTLDDKYVEVLVAPIRRSRGYRPAFGQGDAEDGLSVTQFQTLYGGDPLYSWVGLDSELVYAAHRAAGGITSVYRQLGIGCERLFRTIVQDQLGLNSTQSNWSYKVVGTGGNSQTLRLDARIETDHLTDEDSRARVEDWLARTWSNLGGQDDARPSKGAVFEVRQGYKSADSKRQNADLRNAVQAYAQGYLPVIAVFSQQVSQTVAKRYRANMMPVLVGQLDGDDLTSTFQFVSEVLSYDIVSFFERNAVRIRNEVVEILETLLSAE